MKDISKQACPSTDTLWEQGWISAGEQGWLSGDCTRLPLTWPGSIEDSWPRVD